MAGDRWLVIPAAGHKYLIGMQTWAGPARESVHHSYSVTAFQHLTWSSQQIVLYFNVLASTIQTNPEKEVEPHQQTV